ncbi:MAG: RnfABCDGE type electron transport complex subunit C [Candidatus Natronoplasma sp.]
MAKEHTHHFKENGGFEVNIRMKLETIDDPFTEVPPSDEMTVFLNQHIGPEGDPLVKKGDEVEYGEKIVGFSGKGKMCVPVHSPVNGEIKCFEHVRHPLSEEKERAIIIETKDEEKRPYYEPIDPDEAPRQELLERIREAGIVGLGGAGFPTHVKLGEENISHLIINAKESDPNLASDVRLMMEEPRWLIEGIKLMGHILDVEKIVFATRTGEDETPELERLLRENDVEIKRIRPNYSVGSEKLLVKEVLNKEVPSGKFPPQVGAVVHNVATAYATAKAIKEGESLVSRGMTFYSKKTGGENLWTRMGTSIEQVLDYMGVSPGEFERIALGSAMMGPTIPSPRYPLLKATSGLTGFTPRESDPYEEQKPCIRCGYCNTVCPVDIYPQIIMKAEEKDDIERLKKLNVLDCINCALCSYVCPSNIRLTPYLERAQNKMKKQD